VKKKISAAKPVVQPLPRAAPALESACVALNLRKTANIVSRYYAREMRNAPVRGPLFSLLAMIRKRGSANITALAHDVGLDRTTLTRNLKQLEQRGFIEISQATANKKEISLLPEGARALEAALLHWRRTQESVVRELGEERWSRMRRDLAVVMALGDRI
jgi:DNA-binding MarR family transcriptional regulator